MNNKDGKTFADLFLSDNDNVSKDEITFGNFSSASKKEEPVSFNSFSDIANKSDVSLSSMDIFSSETSEIVNENFISNDIDLKNDIVEEKTLNLDLNNIIESSLDGNVFGFDTNNDSEQSNDKVEEVSVDTNEIVEESNTKELETKIDNSFGADVFGFDTGNEEEKSNNKVEEVSADAKEIVEESNTKELETKIDNSLDFNVFGFDVKNSNEQSNDKKEEVSVDTNEIVEESNTEELETKLDNSLDFNVFGFDVKNSNEQPNDKKEEVSVDTNEIKTNSIISSGNTLKDTKSKEKKVSFDSPFFEAEANGEKDSLNSLLANNISLDESSKTKKKVGKIELGNTKNYNVKVVTKNEPLIKFVVGVISYAFFIWLLLIGITLLVYVLDIKIRAAKGDYSAPTFNAYVVLTGSMLPDIQVNDVVVTKKVEAETLAVGDIITFASADSRFAGTIITHRIIKVNPSKDNNGIMFQTKGDNNNVADSTLVPEGNIYGKVILKIPKLGYLQEFLATDGGWIIVILIPCLTVISYDIVKLFKGLKRRKYDNIKVKK